MWIAPASALAILIIFAFFLLRDWRFAFLVSLSSLPGYSAAALIPVFVLPEHPPVVTAGSLYLCGYVLASFVASAIAIRIAVGDTKLEAVRGTIRRLLPVALWSAILCMVTSVLGIHLGAIPAISGIAAFAALSMASAFFCTALTPLLFSYSEAFIERTNRLRERRDRLLDRLAFLVQPRWGLSIGGIALIFAVLGAFGGGVRPLPNVWQLAAWAAAVFAIAWASCFDLRRGLAATLSILLMALLAYWASAGYASDETAAYLGYATLGLVSLPIALMALQTTLFAKEGDNVTVALLRASERTSVPIAFASTAAALCFLCLQGAVAASALTVCGGLAAILVVPALTTAIHALFPPRVSLEDAFKSR